MVALYSAVNMGIIKINLLLHKGKNICILEKKRLYTLKHMGVDLDPRFITIFTLPIIRYCMDQEFDEITVIQGDVVKKYDYYAFAYLKKEDCPTTVFMHGLVVDGEKKKLRWRDAEETLASPFIFPGVKNKELRAYLLKHNLTDNITIDSKFIKKEVKGQVNLYITMKRLMDERNLDIKKTGVRTELKILYNDFLDRASGMKLSAAYENVQTYIDKCWKLTKGDKLSEDEQAIIRDFVRIYYGG